MTNITTTFTDKELTDLGRAMERAGYTDVTAFIQHATSKLTSEILTEQKP